MKERQQEYEEAKRKLVGRKDEAKIELISSEKGEKYYVIRKGIECRTQHWISLQYRAWSKKISVSVMIYFEKENYALYIILSTERYIYIFVMNWKKDTLVKFNPSKLFTG